MSFFYNRFRELDEAALGQARAGAVMPRSESAVAPGERAFYAFDHERCCASWEQKPLVPYEHVVVDPLHAALNEIGEALELFREHRDREPVRVTK